VILWSELLVNLLYNICIIYGNIFGIISCGLICLIIISTCMCKTHNFETIRNYEETFRLQRSIRLTKVY
jgi:hypothetical protein